MDENPEMIVELDGNCSSREKNKKELSLKELKQ